MPTVHRSSDPSPRPWLAHERIYVGIDIGKSSHTAGLISNTLLARAKRFEQCPHLVFAQSREGFEALATYLTSFTSISQCVVLVESTGHYHKALEQYLLEAGCAVYITHVQKRPSRMMKSDKRDALALGNMLYNQVEKQVQVTDKHDQVRRVAPPSDVARTLRSLVRHRYELVAESTQRKNKLISICDELFPELTTVFKDPNGPSALALRERYPTPLAMAAAHDSDILATRTGSRPSNEQLLALREKAQSSIGTRDTARVAGLVIEQGQLIAELRLLQKHLEELNAKIADSVSGSREGQILLSLGVLGANQAAALIAQIGHIDNFPNAASLKSYLGWAPAITQTGSTVDTTRLSRGGNRPTRHLLYMACMLAVRLDTEWKALYDRLVPVKCAYDERTGRYKGKLKVIGRIAGQMTEMIFMLLRRDADSIRATPEGTEPPPPQLYDRDIHHAHRQGQYRPAKPHASRPVRGTVTPLHPPS